MLLKVGYIEDTFVEYNVIEVPYSILKKYVPIELARYVKNHVFIPVEASRRKGVYNVWSTNVIKGHTIDVKHLYSIKETNQWYRIVATWRSRNNVSEAKYNKPRALKNKLSHN